MNMLSFASLLFAAAISTADVVHDGPCPDLKTVENFNLTAFQGMWYEILKYPSDEEKGGACATAEYTVQDQGLKVRNTHILQDVQTKIEGDAKPSANITAGAAKFDVTFKFADVVKQSPLWILGTDYTSYALAYTCKFDEKSNKHKDYSWVLARNKTMDAATKTAVNDLMKVITALDATKFVETDFSDAACKFSKSSLITEPPKAT